MVNEPQTNTTQANTTQTNAMPPPALRLVPSEAERGIIACALLDEGIAQEYSQVHESIRRYTRVFTDTQERRLRGQTSLTV